MYKYYPVLLREVKNSGSVQAHIACTRFIKEGQSSPMVQWPSFADTLVHFAALIFLGWHLCSSSQTQKPIWPQPMAGVCQPGLIHWTPQNHQEKLRVYEQGWNLEPVLRRSWTLLVWFWIILMLNLHLTRVKCCSLGFRHFVSAVQDTQITVYSWSTNSQQNPFYLQKVTMPRELPAQGISAWSWYSVYDKGCFAPSSFSTTKPC